jgi:hypothetical protein
MNTITTFNYSLSALATALGLPQQYLRDLAQRNLIPFLVVGGRMRFNPKAVGDALDKLACKGECHADR